MSEKQADFVISKDRKSVSKCLGVSSRSMSPVKRDRGRREVRRNQKAKNGRKGMEPFVSSDVGATRKTTKLSRAQLVSSYESDP